MKPKIVLCLTLVLSGIYTAYALAFSLQIKPGEPHPDILIQSGLTAGYCNFCVVLLPQTNFPISILQGDLEINDGTNRLASCPVNGIMLSDVFTKGWGGPEKNEYYRVMTNRLSRSLNGARIFNFQVATNLLVSSTFRVGDYGGGSSFSQWFYLKDFSDEK
jgi:hypothetical protein